MGDIHGAYKALLQCLDRANFDPVADILIQLGDVTDGFPDVYQCVETLLAIPSLVALRGNHDDWFMEFMACGYHPGKWAHGGTATITSYAKQLDQPVKIIPANDGGYKTSLNPQDIPLNHRQFFTRQALYHIDQHNNCYVHGGFDRQLPFAGQRIQNYYWDRTLWAEALQYHTLNRQQPQVHPFYTHTQFHEIYLGHTPTTNWQTDKPMRAVNVLNMDTGAGHNGKLTILDVETKDYWQSDRVGDLYGKSGR
jgi:serine/threonine protein phosphatase 1